MRTLGWCVLAVGVFWLIIALNMDTSVESSPGVRVMNFSLMAQQPESIASWSIDLFRGIDVCDFWKKT